ncbi:GMC family oxidoreductase [Acuticoccus sp. I52.16.1]|uniref:GMC family oxidoreductase n=1 Tax=Acuticoccus sp. I52.16.1 TaxID=2928472 RepID=UPI001FD18E8B|nr:GMC family oxidoreductase N-terminal domain-containing protein [Acuticoccus sp. I52.16.1]UOM32628.1 GMC family oxidoreductase N-terminal domain-containing protein [Acuticoccus sp. I52.16.1]
MEAAQIDHCDVVVVGAGSAGCVVAARLSERADLAVTVVEAGGSDRSIWVRMPIGYGGAFYHPTLNWRYYTEPDEGLGGRKAYWPRGKVVGGSSSINAMVYVRGQAADYDGWAAAGNPGWSYRDLLPYFRRLESNVTGASEWRGGDGPISVRDVAAAAHPLSHAFVEAAVQAGFTRNTDFNGADQEGVGFFQVTTRDGLRCSAATGYLHPALKRRNLTLLTDAAVTRILFDGTRAIGVEVVKGGATRRIMARREVVLSAGAIGSPQILQLSGVGDPAKLAGLGITPVLDAPTVGRNLMDHVGFDLLYEATVPTLNQTLGPLFARGLAGIRYLATRDGPLSLSVNQAGGFVRGGPERARPNLQLYFSPLSYTRAVPGKRRLTQPDRFPGFMIGISNTHPKSRGWLHIRSADPAAAPEIHPHYYSEPEDLEELIDSVALMRGIAEQAPLKRVIKRELTPGPEVTDRGALVAYIRATTTSVFHPCGTCAMGPDAAAGAVVDPALKVHGLTGLRVADASIMPAITAGNLNAPSLMVGEKAADLIRADL